MLNKRIASLILALLLSSTIIGQITISTPTTWSQDTILLSETVVVESGTSLTIAEGTTALFSIGAGLEVNGSLYIQGSEESPVILSAIDSLSWSGIQLLQSGSSYEEVHINFAEIYFATGEEGGGIYIGGKEPIEIKNSKLLYNTADLGAAIHISGSDQTLIENTLVAENESNINGAIYLNSGNVTFTNITVANNTSNGVGGLFSNWYNPNISNSILALNDSANFYHNRSDRTLPAIPRFSLIQEGHIGNSNLSGDPLFSNVSSHDYSLSSGSPAIDAGCHCMLDSDGTRSDMGYKPFVQESPSPLPYVLIDSTSNLNGSWESLDKFYAVCSNITIDAGETLQLGEGIDIRFILNSEVTVKGNLITNASAEHPINITGLDSTFFVYPNADDLHPVQYGWGGINFRNAGTNTLRHVNLSNMGQSYHYFEADEPTNVVQIAAFDESTLILDSCEITKSFVRYDGSYNNNVNGVIYAGPGSTLHVLSCKLESNYAYPQSMIINANESNLRVRSTSFLNNLGSILITYRAFDTSTNQSEVTIDSCYFSMNSYYKEEFPTNLIYAIADDHLLASITGNIFDHNAAIIYARGAFKFSNNQFSNNRSASIIVESYYAEIIGNLIYNNENLNIELGYTELHVLNNTIAGNHTDEGQTITINGSGSFKEISNNIFYENSPSTFISHFDGYDADNHNRSFKSNIISEYIDDKNFTIDPLFHDELNHDYRLAANSPAINVALSDLASENFPERDIMGNYRVDENYGLLDIGALEFQGQISPLNDILLSDTIIFTDAIVGDPVASIFTEESLNVSFYLLDESGFDTQAFSIEETNLILKKPISEGDIFRIKIRAEQTDNDAWLEKSFFIHVSLPLRLNESDISIHPNPAQNTIHLPAHWLNHGISITDLSGKTVRVITKLTNTTLEIGSLKAGTYLIQNGYETHKFIKQKQ